VEGANNRGLYLDGSSTDNTLEGNTLNSWDNYALYAANIRNYISETNIANGEPIYHYYNVEGTATNPIVVENLALTGGVLGRYVSNLGKITVVDSRYFVLRNNILRNGNR
jgi:hypothetical protein